MQKMEVMKEKLEKLREERFYREKARIEKLREMNLKKYNKDGDAQNMTKQQTGNKSLIPNRSDSKTSFKVPPKPSDSLKKSEPLIQTDKPKISQRKSIASAPTGPPRPNNLKTNTIPTVPRKSIIPQKIQSAQLPSAKLNISTTQPPRMTLNGLPVKSNPQVTRKSMLPPKIITSARSIVPPKPVNIPNRKSTSASAVPKPSNNPTRKSIAPCKNDGARESVFDRLYKPKIVASKPVEQVQKIKNDPKFREQVLKNSGLIYNKRHTVFEVNTTKQQTVRRSISAVHFKRIPRSELNNCIQKWSSSENLSKVSLKEIDEVMATPNEKVVSAVKSDRKKVQFQKHIYNKYNTPKADELQSRLKSWLQKRGKSLNSYHHLQCFGLHNVAEAAKELKPYDDEDKENIAVESDSDNDSYCDNTNNKIDVHKWRRASCFDETLETISSEEHHNVDDLLLGALNDLTELVKEGYDWEQSAQWLCAIRSRHSDITETAQYWECRAALEERRGNLPATLHCWEEALANGTKSSVVEANLDQLLDKFMQLKISPTSAKKKPVNSKMVDVKNVFKSTILRFAVQQAKLRQSNQHEAPHYTVTPVRRSSRLTQCGIKTPVNNRTPLVQLCASLKQIDARLAPVFVPNETLPNTP